MAQPRGKARSEIHILRRCARRNLADGGERNYRGWVALAGRLPKAIALLRAGSVDPTSLITRTSRLREAQRPSRSRKGWCDESIVETMMETRFLD